MIKALLLCCLMVAITSFSYQYYALKTIKMRVKQDYMPVEDIIVDRGGDRVVLLLHGFSTGPQEFQSLLPYLDHKKLSYVVPNLVGHNETDTKTLKRVAYQDWEKQILEIYQNLARQYKYVDVIGFSNGGNLALKLSENHKIQNLILINPFATPSSMLAKLYELSQYQVVYFMLKHLVGYVPLDPKMMRPFYQYPYVPYESLFTILQLQANIDFEAVRANAFFLIYALRDDTADYSVLIEDKLGAKLKPEHITVLKHSTHRAMDEDELELIKSALDQAYDAL